MMNVEVASIRIKPKRIFNRFNGCCARCKRRHSVGLRIGSEVDILTVGAEDVLYYNGTSARWIMVTENGSWLPICNNMPVVFCCEREVRFTSVKGRFNVAHKCDARCVNSKGHVCDCACGGQYHGSGYAG